MKLLMFYGGEITKTGGNNHPNIVNKDTAALGKGGERSGIILSFTTEHNVASLNRFVRLSSFS